MKRYIYSKQSVSILDSIDKIDIIVIVSDARKQGHNNLPIIASKSRSEDYDSYSIEELMELDESILRLISSFYALDNLLTAIEKYAFDYQLTAKQKAILSNYYHKRKFAEVQVTDNDIDKVLKLIKNCNHITGPFYRLNQPEKNFEEVHGIEMVKSDYLAILKSLTKDECIGAVKSFDTFRLGSLLFEFDHDPKGYRLKYSDAILTDGMHIYIKILPDYEKNLTIAIVSFHDKLDNTLDEMGE